MWVFVWFARFWETCFEDVWGSRNVFFGVWRLSLWPTCQVFSTTLGRWSPGVPWHPVVGRGNWWFLAAPGSPHAFLGELLVRWRHTYGNGSWFLFPIRNISSNGGFFTVMLVFMWTCLVWQLGNLSFCTFPKRFLSVVWKCQTQTQTQLLWLWIIPDPLAGRLASISLLRIEHVRILVLVATARGEACVCWLPFNASCWQVWPKQSKCSMMYLGYGRKGCRIYCVS